MRKQHNFKEVSFARCPKCKQKDFIKEKCTDTGCNFENTKSPLCKCAKRDLAKKKKDSNKPDDYKRSTWRGM